MGDERGGHQSGAPRGLDRRSTIGEFAHGSITIRVAEVVRTDAELRSSGDGEAVRRARIATRRLLHTLRSVRHVLERDAADPVVASLNRRRIAMGAAREPDLIRRRIEAGSGKPVPPELGPVLVAVRQEWHTGMVELFDVLNSAHQQELLLRLGEPDALPIDPTADMQRRARKILTHEIDRAWRRTTRLVEREGLEPADETLHEIRRRVRRTRDTIDGADGLVKAPVRDMARVLRRVQRLLGEHQDALVTAAWLQAVPTRRILSPGEAFAAGQVAGGQLAAAQSARTAFPALWAEVAAVARSVGLPEPP